MVYESRQDKIFLGLVDFLLVVIMLVVLYPLIFVACASVSDPNAVSSGQMVFFPVGFTLEGYRRVLGYSVLWQAYLNTILYTVLGTIINLLMTVICAYPLSRHDLPHRAVFSSLFVFTMFFGGGLVPSYMLVRSLGLLDTVGAMVIPCAISMYNVVIVRTYIQNSIPYELQEAAFIDGCSDFRMLVSIIIPSSLPVLAVMTLFYGVGHWNDYFSALIYLNKRDMMPLQIVLRDILLLNQQNSQLMQTSSLSIEELAWRTKLAETMKYSIIIVSSIPALMLYPLIQKYFIKGIMVGALKG